MNATENEDMISKNWDTNHDPERWARVQEIFTGACAVAREWRDAYLREQCGEDDELLAEVSSLLADASDAAGLLDRPIDLRSESPPDPAELVLKDLEITGLLGRGGMGAVYRAFEPSLRRTVAVKVLPQLLALSPTRVARFEREAGAIGRLQHPAIVPVHRFGRSDGVPYLVMDLVDWA